MYITRYGGLRLALVGAFESERRFEGADKSPHIGDVLSVLSAADQPNQRRGSWAFHRPTNRQQRTRVAVAIDQNATAIPWLVAQDLTSDLSLPGVVLLIIANC